MLSLNFGQVRRTKGNCPERPRGICWMKEGKDDGGCCWRGWLAGWLTGGLAEMSLFQEEASRHEWARDACRSVKRGRSRSVSARAAGSRIRHVRGRLAQRRIKDALSSWPRAGRADACGHASLAFGLGGAGPRSNWSRVLNQVCFSCESCRDFTG